MGELRFLIELAGEAALLLWGLHMVQSGVMRAFGSRLRQRLVSGLGNRWSAFTVGLAVTAILQSSTATAFMVASFAAGGVMALIPALSAMLGANVATALIVQVLAFDITVVFPALVLIGVIAFRNGRVARTRDLGRASIGLGLMLLALHLMTETMLPVEHSPALRTVLAAVSDQPFINLIVAAALAWAMHSSVAAVLFIASLHGAGVVAPQAALAMVAGANLGSALNPLLEGERGEWAKLRVPVGNLANRVIGCVILLALLPQAAALLAAVEANPARFVANAHLAFNLILALLFLPLLQPLAQLLERALPEASATRDPAAPRYLEEAALGTPPVALANAEREVLRMADMLEAMLVSVGACLRNDARDIGKRIKAENAGLDRLHRAVQLYLATLRPDLLGDEERRRVEEVRQFALNLASAGDIMERGLSRDTTRHARLGHAAAEDLAAMEAMHGRSREQLRLAVAVFLRGDVAAARRLIAEKERMRLDEAEAARRFADAAQGSAIEAAELRMKVVRDLKSIGAHLAVAAHPALVRSGDLRASRLVENGGVGDEGLTPA